MFVFTFRAPNEIHLQTFILQNTVHDDWKICRQHIEETMEKIKCMLLVQWKVFIFKISISVLFV